MKKTSPEHWPAQSSGGGSLASALSHQPVDKRIDILRLVGESGSISQAAREAKVSYKAAWQAIDTLTNLAGVALVERAVGGAGGGGASVTAAGQKLLVIARLLNETRSQVLASYTSAEQSLSGALPVLANMGVRTSMRNQLPCQIQKLVREGQVVRVYLRLANQALLVSRITQASAELLGLQKGQQVLALCKATAVVVTPWPSDAAAPSQSLTSHCVRGQAVRISRGAAGDEVSLQLDAGLQLVGFAAAGRSVKTGALLQAFVDESALVIALVA